MSLAPRLPRPLALTRALPEGSTITSDEINNVATAGGGGMVSFVLDIDAQTLNGIAIPTSPDDVPAAIVGFLGGTTDDEMRICLNVTADAGSTTLGSSYPAQAIGSFCVNFRWAW